MNLKSANGKVSEDATAQDAKGVERKTFHYQGIIFRSDDRREDNRTLQTGFTSKNDLSVSANRTEAMGLGAKSDDGSIGGWGATGTSGVSCAKHVGGAIDYVNETGTFYIIDTTKLPKNEKAWEMENTVYQNGYKKRAPGGEDETGGEVNVSFIPRNAIVGRIFITPGFNIYSKKGAERLQAIQDRRENF